MNALELHQYIQHLDSLPADLREELKQLMEAYPYFQTAKLLYLKALSSFQNPDFENELKRLAIDVANRKVLYTLVNGKEEAPSESSDEQQNATTSSFDLIDAFLASNPLNQTVSEKTETLLLEPSATTDYFHSVQYEKGKEEEEAQASDSPEVKLKHQDLIDSFIAGDSTRKIIFPEETAADTEVDVEDPVEEVSIKSLDDTYFTETLARIYVKQKRYDRALQIIRNLNLKYPEKNIYFADQIRFLEKLIINTKK
ncbi:MAG TPA: hypothetical protein H9778_00910 [Candidatus Parabacteroides intestinavium]|nr:hypothetical protein [Candidatus Parabacteroides intestinavium]